MQKLKLQVRMAHQLDLPKEVQKRVGELMRVSVAAETRAARTATQASRRAVQNRRPFAAPRPGRNHLRISRALRFFPDPDGGEVKLNTGFLDDRAPHWIIQNIGTNQSATLKRGGPSANPVGRPKKGASYVRKVKSQQGRRISSGLVFATGPRGSWSRPGSAVGQQLYLRKHVSGVPFGNQRDRSQPGIRIGKEIRPQRFVQEGVKEGFSEYRSSVLAVARQQFRRGRKP